MVSFFTYKHALVIPLAQQEQTKRITRVPRSGRARANRSIKRRGNVFIGLCRKHTNTNTHTRNRPLSIKKTSTSSERLRAVLRCCSSTRNGDDDDDVSRFIVGFRSPTTVYMRVYILLYTLHIINSVPREYKCASCNVYYPHISVSAFSNRNSN